MYLGNEDSSVVRASDSGSKGSGFESPQERKENVLHGQLSVLITVAVILPTCYRSST